MLKTFINKLVHAPETYRHEDTRTAVDHILSGQCTDAQTASFLTALTCFEAGLDHLLSALDSIQSQAIMVPGHEDAFDCCGTGGDGLHTLNISTAVSFCLAGLGVKMAKHGNRSASSKCGAADVLEACGISLIADPDKLADALSHIGYAFLMAPNHHPALRHLSPIRKEIGIRTLLNMTGPLLNPAGTKTQLIGTYSEDAQTQLSQVIQKKAGHKAWIVHAKDGMDEVSLAAPTRFLSSSGRSWVWGPDEFGISIQPLETIKGGDADYNAAALMRLLDGERGPYHDAVVLNAASALLLLEQADTPLQAAERASAALTNGQAKAVFDRYRQWSQS